MRIAAMGVGSLSIDTPLKYLERWWQRPRSAAAEWRTRALDAEFALTLERARVRLIEQRTADYRAQIAATLGWMRDFARAARE